MWHGLSRRSRTKGCLHLSFLSHVLLGGEGTMLWICHLDDSSQSPGQLLGRPFPVLFFRLC